MKKPPADPSRDAWQWLEARPRKWQETGWPRHPVWSLEGLRNHYGEHRVTVSDTQHTDTPTRTRLDHFLEYCLGGPYPRPNYLHWWFGPTAPELTLALDLPWYFRCWLSRLPESLDPELRWLLAGPLGSGTPWHEDVFQTTAWCHVLTGAKAWDIRSPRNHSGPEITEKWIQQPGESVYIPSGWPHRVDNLEPTLALSGNIVNPSNWRSVVNALHVERPSWAPIVSRLAERFA